MKTQVDGDTRYACRFCGVHYKGLVDCYDKHVKSKHLGMTFQCPYCRFSTCRKYCLNRHVDRFHGNKSSNIKNIK